MKTSNPKLERDNDRYIVTLDGERIGFLRRSGRGKWNAVDTYMERVRDFPSRIKAIEWLVEIAGTQP